MKIAELRAKTVEELKQHIEDLGKEIFDLRCELRLTRKLENPHLLTQKKKEKARSLTLLTEKQATGAK